MSGQAGHWGDAEGFWGLVSRLGTGSGAAGALVFGEYRGDSVPGMKGNRVGREGSSVLRGGGGSVA